MNARSAWPLVAVLLLGAPAAADDAVVARVQGPHGAFSIGLDRLEAYLAAHPGKTARAGLQDLVDFELLAAEAAAAQAAAAQVAGTQVAGTQVADAQVQTAADQAMVARWLKQVFEPAWTPQTLPEEMVRQSYDSNRSFFDHPELRVGAHILVTTPEDTRPTGEQDAAARALAERIARDLQASPPESADVFRSRGYDYEADAKAVGLEVKAQSLGRFARKGRYVEAFGAAAFAIEEAGVASDPFPTRFGWHIVRLDEIIPEKRQTFEQAQAQIRARITPEVRQFQLMKLGDMAAEALPKLRPAPGVRGLLDPGPLDAIAARRGLLSAPEKPAAPTLEPGTAN